MDNLPKHLKFKVAQPALLRNGLPYIYHSAYEYDFSFKTLNTSDGKTVKPIPAAKQLEFFTQILSSTLTTPFLLGIGSYPTEKGCNAAAAKLLYGIKENNKSFEIFTISALTFSPEKASKCFGDKVPEVLCIMDLCEDSGLLPYSIENARALISAYRNSILIVPVATQNIVEFINQRLHTTGAYLQFAGLKKSEKV